jgi:hypothetical protein
MAHRRKSGDEMTGSDDDTTINALGRVIQENFKITRCAFLWVPANLEKDGLAASVREAPFAVRRSPFAVRREEHGRSLAGMAVGCSALAIEENPRASKESKLLFITC